LTERDAEKAHPVSAITGLNEKLDVLSKPVEWGNLKGELSNQEDLTSFLYAAINAVKNYIPLTLVAEGNTSGSNSVELELLNNVSVKIQGTNVTVNNKSAVSKNFDIRRSNIYDAASVGSYTGDNTTIAANSSLIIQTLTATQQSSQMSVIGYLRDVANNIFYNFGYFTSGAGARTTIYAQVLKDNREARTDSITA
jgi:hypothetical protein